MKATAKFAHNANDIPGELVFKGTEEEIKEQAREFVKDGLRDGAQVEPCDRGLRWINQKPQTRNMEKIMTTRFEELTPTKKAAVTALRAKIARLISAHRAGLGPRPKVGVGPNPSSTCWRDHADPAERVARARAWDAAMAGDTPAVKRARAKIEKIFA